MYYNRFFTFFCVLNLYLLVRCVERAKPQRYLCLAGAILLSGFFKFEVALFSFLCSLVVFIIQSFLKTKQQHSLIQEYQVSFYRSNQVLDKHGIVCLGSNPRIIFFI